MVGDAASSAASTAPGMAGATGTKAAIISLVKSVALDVGPYGIRVNAVCPGPTRDTAMFDRLDEREPRTYEGLRRAIAAVGLARRDRRRDAILAVRRRLVRHRAPPVVVDGGVYRALVADRVGRSA